MEQNTLGILLSYYRTKYKLSMEQVIDGICSTSTLHRIENGGREVDFLVVVAQHYYTGEEKESMQAEIWMELIYLTEEQETGSVLMTYIDRAIDALANGRRMKYLGELHFRKARLIEECYHKTEEWSTQETECKHPEAHRFLCFRLRQLQLTV